VDRRSFCLPKMQLDVQRCMDGHFGRSDPSYLNSGFGLFGSFRFSFKVHIWHLAEGAVSLIQLELSSLVSLQQSINQSISSMIMIQPYIDLWLGGWLLVSVMISL
jgi:hypothetical protein